LIQKRAVFIPPALLISAQVIMGVIAGAIGIVLATPLALVIIIFAQKLYLEGAFGEKIAVLGEHKSPA
jgi:predicted PurR-regulated permease PerM